MESREREELPSADRRRGPEPPAEEYREPNYHVYIRLPFNRGDFVDPGTVNWSEKKSEALWSILSDSLLGNVDWTRLAGEFDVSVEFLLQMANYLTERHTSHLKAHMLKAAAARGSNTASPVPGAEPGGGSQGIVPLDHARRISLGNARAPSALSMRKETVTPSRDGEDSSPAGLAGSLLKNALPIRPGSSRASSGNTTVPTPIQQHQVQPGSRPGTATRLSDTQRRRMLQLAEQQEQQPQQQQQQQHQQVDAEHAPPSPAASTSSSPSSSSSGSPVQSRIIRRPPRHQTPRDPRGGGNGPFGGGNGDDEDDEDEDAEPAFLPYNPQGSTRTPTAGIRHQHRRSSSGGAASYGQDLGATLRGTYPRQRHGSVGDASQSQSQTSDSSIGSAAVVQSPNRPTTAGASDNRRLPPGANAGLQGPLSPRRTAERAAARSSSTRGGKGTSREGSEGTPSMGSSFSDLDDASVTQSALEEALASRMQDGTIGSRMSVIGGTIGHAFRSRYLPKPNRQ